MKKRLLSLIVVFIAWLPVFVIQKPVFMFYQAMRTSAYSLSDYLQVMLHGLKLDCTLAGYLTVLPLLGTLATIWWPGNWFRKSLKGYFLLTAILIAAIFSVDVALYGFWGFRLDATLFFYLRSPAEAMASVPWGLFFLQLALFILYAGAIYAWWSFLLRRFEVEGYRPLTSPLRKMGGALALCLLGGIMFIPIRGGVTTSTANVGMVYFSQDQFLNHAAINPCFSLMASLSKQQDFAAQFDFFPEEKRKELFDSLVSPVSHVSKADSLPEISRLLTTKRPNLLIILLESFSANAIEAVGGKSGITPQFNRLSQEGILFSRLYANSFRTDRGLVAVLNGYLAQPTTSIMKYPAKSQTLPSIAKSLGQAGYKADMLYGGDINFTNMQSYFFSSGYQRITSDRDFPLTSRLSKWGANDDVTFAHLYEEIRRRPANGAPWMTTFLTLSSHEPFEVPYHQLEHPYLNSVAFTDSCLGDFIDKLKELPCWKNTLVILVADHGYRYPDEVQEPETRRYHIPMVWLGGAVDKPRLIDTYANQTDLAATLLHQLELPADEFIFSKDILDPRLPHYAFYTFNNGFGFIDETGVSVFDNESNRPLIEQPQEGSETRLDKGKALLQTLYDDLGGR